MPTEPTFTCGQCGEECLTVLVDHGLCDPCYYKWHRTAKAQVPFEKALKLERKFEAVEVPLCGPSPRVSVNREIDDFFTDVVAMLMPKKQPSRPPPEPIKCCAPGRLCPACHSLAEVP